MPGPREDTAGGSPPAAEAEGRSYGSVLVRVLSVQVVALLLLWLLQAHYGG